MVKISIVCFAVIAFLGPVLLFVTAAVLYRRLKRRREQQGLNITSISSDDHNWPQMLKQKADPSKINLADVHLVVIEAKRSPGSSAGSITSSRIGAGGAVSPARSTSITSSRDGSASPGQPSPQAPATATLLTPPPPAALAAPDSHSVDVAALASTRQQEPAQCWQQEQPPAAAPAAEAPQTQAHCVLQMPPKA